MAESVRYWIRFREGGAGWTEWRECPKWEYDRYQGHWQYDTKATKEPVR